MPAESLVVTAAFAADERFLVTGEIEGNIRVWEAPTQRRVAGYSVDSWVEEAWLSHGGRLVVVG